jgi:autotransporter-associated beta strand protein
MKNNSRFLLKFSLSSQRAKSLASAVTLVLVWLSCVVTAHANTLTWSGGAVPNANWNDSANWGGAGIPGNGDTIIFSGSHTNAFVNTNNIANLTLNQIQFVGDNTFGVKFDLRGNAFTLTGSILATNVTGTNIIENNITLPNASELIVVSNSDQLIIEGTLSGPGGVTMAGFGTLTYQCAGDNTYTGTTLVISGTLQFNVSGSSAVSGPLVIGTGQASVLPTVEDLQDFEMLHLPSLTINYQGNLNLNNFDDYSSTNVTLNNGDIETGSGTLTLSAPTTITETISGDISGYLSSESGTLTFDVTDGLVVDANLSSSDSINLLKTGPGSLFLYGNNSYTGTNNIETGWIFISTGTSLGSSANSTIVSNGATLSMQGNFSVTNASLTLNGLGEDGWGALDCETFYGTTTWVGPITLNADSNFGIYPAGTTLCLNGPISGPGGLIEYADGYTGSFTLTNYLCLEGSTANTYEGSTTVSNGTLQLDKSYAIPAVPGALVIESNSEVQLLDNFQINNPFASVTMADTSLFNLNGYDEWVGPISIQGAQITTGAGFLYLGGNIAVNPSIVAQSYITGNAILWNGSYVITNTGHWFSPDLVFSANLSSGGTGVPGLVKDGNGEVSLSGNNTFAGPVTVNNGNLWARSSTALGSTNYMATVNSGGCLFLDGSGLDFGLKPLVLNGSGWTDEGIVVPNGALFITGSGSWEGNITLASTATVTPNEASTLTLAGPISGAGGLSVEGSFVGAGGGDVTLGGTVANSYGGTTEVSDATLTLNKSEGIGAVPGNIIIYYSGIILLDNYSQTAGTADVLINSGGLFNFSIFYTYMDTLHGTGTVNFGAGGWVLLGLNNGTSEFDGNFTGTGYASGYTVGKTGAGTFTIGGNSTYTAGVTEVSQGKAVINGSQPKIPVTVDSGATLAGTGLVGPVTANGVLSPGNSLGILNSSNVTFSSTGNLTVELAGTTAGSGYSQLNATGAVTLASATLTVVPAFTSPPAIGQQFTILNDAGATAISGTFNGLPNGTLFSQGGYTYRINYTGGTGKDVVLTLWGVPGDTVTLTAVDQGWYNSSGYNDSDSDYLDYSVGQNSEVGDTNLYRDWFAFNIPVFGGSIIHAELLINCYTNSATNGQDTLLLRAAPPAATLESGGGSTTIYNSFATGAVYSVRSISTNEAGLRAIIPLNAQFFNDAAAASGGQMALCGTIADLPTNTNGHNQYLFADSGRSSSDVELRLTFGTSVLTNVTTAGWYQNTGANNAGALNYFAGDLGGPLYRDFFVFNLPPLASEPVDAQLLVNAAQIVSPTGEENYTLYDVTNSITLLTNILTTSTNVYSDLGSGVAYGGREVYASENELVLDLPLDGAFITAASAASPGRIALGGALTSLISPPTDEYLFGASEFEVPSGVQLWLGFLNTPASQPTFVGATPDYLGNNKFQWTVSGTAGTTNEIQGSFDFQRWDYIGDLNMTGANTPFYFTNTNAAPYQFFRAERLQ